MTILKQIEIESAATNRLLVAILQTLTEEQRQDIHKRLEHFSLQLVSELGENNQELYDREQAVRLHAASLVTSASRGNG